MAYGARALWSRRRRSTRRTGKPSTWERTAGACGNETGRSARCLQPQLSWSQPCAAVRHWSAGYSERRTSGAGRGGQKRAGNGTSLAAYSTHSRCQGKDCPVFIRLARAAAAPSAPCRGRRAAHPYAPSATVARLEGLTTCRERRRNHSYPRHLALNGDRHTPGEEQTRSPSRAGRVAVDTTTTATRPALSVRSPRGPRRHNPHADTIVARREATPCPVDRHTRVRRRCSTV